MSVVFDPLRTFWGGGRKKILRASRAYNNRKHPHLKNWGCACLYSLINNFIISRARLLFLFQVEYVLSASENLKCQGARDCLPNIEKLESL